MLCLSFSDMCVLWNTAFLMWFACTVTTSYKQATVKEDLSSFNFSRPGLTAETPIILEYKYISLKYGYTEIPTKKVTGQNTKTLADIILNLTVYKVYRFIDRNFVYITSVPGLITNPLTIYLAAVMKPRTTSEIYMFVLGVTDFLVVLLRLSIKIMVQSNYQWTDLICRAMYYSANVAYVFSNWILVAWTIERTVAVVFPLKLNIWYSNKKVLTILSVILATNASLFVPELIEISSVYTSAGRRVCFYSQYYYKYYAMIENCFYIYIPMTIVVVGNIIILKMNILTKTRVSKTLNQETLSRRTSEHKQMIRTLVTVACAFVILHIPQVLAKIWQALFPIHSRNGENEIRNYYQFQMIMNLGYQITDYQNSINFFLYCACGSKVRKALKTLIRFNLKDQPLTTESKTISVVTKQMKYIFSIQKKKMEAW